MKQVIVALTFISSFAFSCKSTGSMATIQPKFGIIDIPATGECRIWRDLVHPSFNVTLTNNASSQSCEVYKVTDNGNEKWIIPSLVAGKSIKLKIPANGHLFLKNFNPTVLKIAYKIEA